MSVSKTIMVLAMTGGIFVSADWAFAQFGVPISDPAPLNTDAPTESRNDIEPHITTDGLGNWLAVWHSEDSLSGAIGTDRDIFFSRKRKVIENIVQEAAEMITAG